MKTQYTYPPLLVADSGRNTWVVFYNLPSVGDQELNQKVIAEVEDVELARLIAAAPETAKERDELKERAQLYADKIVDLGRINSELLEALEKIEFQSRDAKGSVMLMQIWDEAIAAIKKAKPE